MEPILLVLQTSIRVRVLDADDQNPAFYFDKYSAQVPEETSQGVKLQVNEPIHSYKNKKILT